MAGSGRSIDVTTEHPRVPSGVEPVRTVHVRMRTSFASALLHSGRQMRRRGGSSTGPPRRPRTARDKRFEGGGGTMRRMRSVHSEERPARSCACLVPADAGFPPWIGVPAPAATDAATGARLPGRRIVPAPPHQENVNLIRDTCATPARKGRCLKTAKSLPSKHLSHDVHRPAHCIAAMCAHPSSSADPCRSRGRGRGRTSLQQEVFAMRRISGPLGLLPDVGIDRRL
jgi:hypothetical protein